MTDYPKYTKNSCFFLPFILQPVLFILVTCFPIWMLHTLEIMHFLYICTWLNLDLVWIYFGKNYFKISHEVMLWYGKVVYRKVICVTITLKQLFYFFTHEDVWSRPSQGHQRGTVLMILVICMCLKEGRALDSSCNGLERDTTSKSCILLPFMV